MTNPADHTEALEATAPNGTKVLVCQNESGLFLELDSRARNGVDAVVTRFAVTRETFATILEVMMNLKEGLDIPNVGTVHSTNKPVA